VVGEGEGEGEDSEGMCVWCTNEWLYWFHISVHLLLITIISSKSSAGYQGTER